LGLVELADEEFEVHGPRLNRYSLNWAMYLGHHWGYRREAGEMQIAVNYYRAFNDFLARFVFGKGVHFRSPKSTEAIIPDRLERIWDVDNDKSRVLLEMAQQGGIKGDCFVKISSQSTRCVKCSSEINKLVTAEIFDINPDVLRKEIWEIPMNQLAKKYGCSDKLIAKRCSKYGIEKPPRGYFLKK
jgi:hypothetical protein